MLNIRRCDERMPAQGVWRVSIQGRFASRRNGAKVRGEGLEVLGAVTAVEFKNDWKREAHRGEAGRMAREMTR